MASAFAEVAGGAADALAAGNSSDGKSYSSFDSSGWNVNFGSGGISSSRSQAGELQGYLPYMVLAVGALLAWRLMRK